MADEEYFGLWRQFSSMFDAQPEAGERAYDYVSGNAAGEALAILHLKLHRMDRSPQWGTLQHPVLDEIKHVLANGSHSVFARGKIVGFLGTLDGWLRHSARLHGSHLDDISLEKTQESHADALDGGPGRRFEERQAKLRSEQARAAANVRWAKARNADTRMKFGRANG